MLILIILFEIAFCDVHSVSQTQFYANNSLSLINFEVETGYITVYQYVEENPKANNQFFYQLILKEANLNILEINEKDPLILWLEGGPGCSSLMSLYQSIGPFRVKENQSITLEQYSWNKQAHLLFLDQPFGSGLSWSFDDVDNTPLAAQYFADFLYQFFHSHQQFLKSPFYIFGQGYAGHFIPTFARQLFKNESLIQLGINYQGIAIGDPWISSFHQVTYYASFLFSVGMVDPTKRDNIQHMTTKIQLAILNGQFAEAEEIQYNLSYSYMNEQTYHANPYNYKQFNDTVKGAKPYWDFINTNKDQFRIPDQLNYQDCNDTVYETFQEDISKSFEGDIVYMLKKGRVLLYNGQLDYAINIPGTQVWINQMKWDLIPFWKMQKKKKFSRNGVTVGMVKTYSNFSFATIYKAGSYVAIDRPDVAFDLLSHFLSNHSDWVN